MGTWTFQQTVETSATAEQIWAVWAKPESWPLWDNGVEWVKTEGPFIKGTKGVMKPAGGPKVKFEMLAVEPLKGFQDRSFLPLTTLDFIHSFTPASGGKKAAITHRVEMRGLLTFIFRRVIGSNIEKDLLGAMAKLVALAERSK
jgi:Polyketide cyclase / dehydrase and lipid transport